VSRVGAALIPHCDLAGELSAWQTKNRVPIEPGWNMWVLAVNNAAFRGDDGLKGLISVALKHWFAAPTFGPDGVDSLAMGPRSSKRPVASSSRLLRRTEDVPGPGPTLRMAGDVSYVTVAFVSRRPLLDLAWPVYTESWFDTVRDCPISCDLALVEARVPPNLPVPEEPTSTLEDFQQSALTLPETIAKAYAAVWLVGGVSALGYLAYLALRRK
jgi:hypothetical protein